MSRGFCEIQLGCIAHEEWGRRDDLELRSWVAAAPDNKSPGKQITSNSLPSVIKIWAQ